jgi:hypothetical protein
MQGSMFNMNNLLCGIEQAWAVSVSCFVVY